MELITARKGEAHITPKQDAFWHQGILGMETCVLNVGEMLAATVVSNTQIDIGSGIGSLQGRFFIVPEGSAESVVIQNGTQGENRKDLIVAKITVDGTKDTQSISLEVIQGTPVAGTANAPEVENGNLNDGDLQVYMPLYEVELNGINIKSVERLFDVHVLPIFMGGTGADTAEGTRKKLGLGNTTGPLPLENGGLGTNFSGTIPPHAIIRATSDLNQYPYLYYQPTKKGVFYATEENGAPMFDVAPLSVGGTGTGVDLFNAPPNAIVRKLKSDNYNQLYYTATKKGAFYATAENGAAEFGTLPLECGGLGRKDINVAPPYSILRAPSDWSEYPYISTTATANGAFYATATNGQPKFGTLPIAQGGTGAKTVEDVLENLGFESIGFAVSSVNLTPMGLTASQGASEILNNKSRYVKSGYCEPQVFLNFRVNIGSNAPIYANKYYSVAKIPSNQKPLITTALNCINTLTDSARILTAHIDTDGVVWVKSSTEISTSSSLNLSITGAWVVC